MGISLFLTGIMLSAILERLLARKPAGSFLLTVLALEIVLICLAYFALTSLLAVRLGLFVICMALALGLQNGAWRGTGGITVHSTYLTGMITSLLTSGTQRYISKATRAAEPDPKISLLSGIWVAFIAGAALGATLVLHYHALGILGPALVLLALLIIEFATIRRRPDRDPSLQ